MSDWQTDPQPAGGGSHYGGSIEQTLAGGADLEVMDVIREAWDRIDGIKGTVVAGLLLMYGMVFVATAILGSIFGFDEQSVMAGTVSQIVIMSIVYPFMAGVFMLGLRRSVGLPVDFKDQFSFYGMMLPIVALGLLQSVLTSLGLMLLILPGLYLAVALSLAIPLKVEKDLGIMECLGTSLRLVNRKFLPVLLLGLASTALIVVGILSLIGWIWTIPWSVMIYAITYRQLAGYDPEGHGDGPATVSY
jgi:uncharacterized membrane protein